MSDEAVARSLRVLAWTKLVQGVRYVRARLQLRGAHFRGTAYSHGALVVNGASGITLGPRTSFVGELFPSEVSCYPGAEIVIGPDTGFNYGVSLVARQSIRIGARCLFGAMVRVSDDDGSEVKPVRIGDDVWIAHGAIIEPGVVIGDSAVVAAGSVVRTSVPAHTMAVGNPARCIPLEMRPRPTSSPSASSGR